MNSIKLLVYDFDYMMTGNKVYFGQQFKEIFQVNRIDGIGVSGISNLGDTAKDIFYGNQSCC